MITLIRLLLKRYRPERIMACCDIQPIRKKLSTGNHYLEWLVLTPMKIISAKFCTTIKTIT